MRHPPAPAEDVRRISRLLAHPALLLFFLVATVAPPLHLIYQSRYGAAAQLRELRQQARAAVGAGRPADAVGRLERAILLDPQSAAAHQELAEALLRLGERERARGALERAVALDPAALEPRIRLATIAVEMRDPARASDQLDWLLDPERGARARPYGETIQMLRADVARLTGDPRACAAAADQALMLNTRSVPAMLVRADMELFAGAPGRARELLARWIEVVADDPRLRIALSRAAEADGDRAAARAAMAGLPAGGAHAVAVALRRAELAAADRDPRAVEPILAALADGGEAGARRYAEALLAEARGDPRAAAIAYRRALDADRLRFGARMRLARALLALEDYAGARAELHAVRDDDPLFPGAQLELARATLLAGELELAARMAEDLVRRAPRHVDAVELLVTARSRLGQAESAADVLGTIARRDPSNRVAAFGRSLAWLAAVETRGGLSRRDARPVAERSTLRSSMETLSAGYATRRGFIDTLARLRRLVGTDPRLASVRIQLAQVYVGLDRLDLAEAELLDVLARAPGAVEAHLALSDLARRGGDLARAEAQALAYLRRRDDPVGRLHLARARLARGEPAGALEVAERALPDLLLGEARESALSLSWVGIAAALELGDLARAGRLFERIRRLDPEASPRALAAGAIALDRLDAVPAAARPLIEAPDPEERPDRDGSFMAAIVALRRGELERAVAHARAAGLAGSIGRATVRLHASLLAGDRPAALRAIDDLRASAPIDPAVRNMCHAMRDHAERVPLDALAAIAAPLHRLLVAWDWGLRAPLRELGAELMARHGELEIDGEPPVLVPLLVAHAFEEAGELALAEQALEQGAARSPRQAPVLLALGSVRIDRGDYAEAAALLDRIMRLASDEPRWTFGALLGPRPREVRSAETMELLEHARPELSRPTARPDVAWVLLHHRDELDALGQALRPLAGIQGAEPSGERELGLRRLLHDRVTEVIALLARARAAPLGEAAIRFQLGLAYRRQARLPEALDELEMAIILEPDGEEAVSAAQVREQIRHELEPGRPGASFEAARPLALGEELVESLGPPGARHVHRVELSGPGRVALRFTGPADGTTEVAIGRRGPRGPRELKATPVPRAGALLWRLRLPAGTYTVDVQATGRPTIADYRLTVVEDAADAEDADDVEPNDAIEDAVDLTAGVTLRPRLGPLADRDVFALPASPSPIDLRVTAPDDEAIVLRLLARTGLGEAVWKTVTVAAGERTLVPGVRVPAEGLAVAVSAAAGPGSGGRYALRVDASRLRFSAEARPLLEPDDVAEAAHAPPASDGAAVAHAGTVMPADDRDWVRLPPAGCSVSLRAPADLALRVEAVIDDGAMRPRAVRAFEVAPGATLRVPAIGAPGLALVIAAREPGACSTVPYRLEVGPAEPTADLEPNDALGSGAAIGPDVVSGLLDSADDRDVFRPAARDEAIALEVRALDAELVVSLVTFTPAGEVRVQRRIAVAPGRALSIAQWVPGAGAPALEVEAAGAGGRYELSALGVRRRRELEVEPNESPGEATPLEPAREVTGALDGAGDVDVFALRGAGEVEILVETLEGPPPAAVAIIGGTGGERRRLVPEGGLLRARLLAPDDAECYIEVRSSSPASVGRTSYRLQVRG